LTDNDCEELERLLLKGATSYGWQNNLWTAARVGRLIFEHFEVKYDPGQVSRILRDRLNWTCQRPVNQQAARNDKAVATWVKEAFSRIVREARKRSGFLVFIDETGFMLEPNVRRTYAPCGKTPTNRISTPHARISVAGAITLDMKDKKVGMVYHILPDNTNFRGESLINFIRSIRAKLQTPMTILWDQIPIHQCEPVEHYLSETPDLLVEPFPPYAPELNAADGIWRYIKHGRLPNYGAPDLPTLRGVVITELNRLKRRETLLHSFIRFTKLPLEF
jgi:transposase